ncbi:MAG: hypothetical protein DWQ05_16005 [Calditrichaeota bacterium]|nr:MAG: hypothetical protein DWQ05_16005 [Calditrichota bacterium]
MLIFSHQMPVTIIGYKIIDCAFNSAFFLKKWPSKNGVKKFWIISVKNLFLFERSEFKKIQEIVQNFSRFFVSLDFFVSFLIKQKRKCIKR